MTGTTEDIRTWVRGSTEYLSYQVTADVDLEDDIPIAITFDRDTFITATWIGTVGHTRTCQALLDDTQIPSAVTTRVYLRLTDNPEIPLIPAGSINFI